LTKANDLLGGEGGHPGLDNLLRPFPVEWDRQLGRLTEGKMTGPKSAPGAGMIRPARRAKL